MEFNPFDYRPFLVRERVAVEEFTQESPLWERAWEMYNSPGEAEEEGQEADKLLFLNDLRFYMVCVTHSGKKLITKDKYGKELSSEKILQTYKEMYGEELIPEETLQSYEKKNGKKLNIEEYVQSCKEGRYWKKFSYEEILQRGCPDRANDPVFCPVAEALKEYVANPFCGESLGDLSPRGEVPDKIDRLRHDYGLPEDWWFLLKAYLEAHPDDATLDKLYGPSELRNLKTILDSQTSHKQSVEGEEKSAIYHLLKVEPQYKSSVMEFLNELMEDCKKEKNLSFRLAPIAAFYDEKYFVTMPPKYDIEKSYPDSLKDIASHTIDNNLSNFAKKKGLSGKTQELIAKIKSRMRGKNLPEPQPMSDEEKEKRRKAETPRNE